MIADIEIRNVVTFSIDQGQIISMNDSNEEYKAILLENNAKVLSENYKKHLTTLITEEIPYAVIVGLTMPMKVIQFHQEEL